MLDIVVLIILMLDIELELKRTGTFQVVGVFHTKKGMCWTIHSDRLR
jgi:hypothetical protein